MWNFITSSGYDLFILKREVCVVGLSPSRRGETLEQIKLRIEESSLAVFNLLLKGQVETLHSLVT